MLAIEETQGAMPNEPQCFPGWANNSKRNKNIITINGIFIVGLIFYFNMGLAISTRFGVITISQGQLYFFAAFCCFPILLPAIHFMRNPKHLISVLQDHNFMPNTIHREASTLSVKWLESYIKSTVIAVNFGANSRS